MKAASGGARHITLWEDNKLKTMAKAIIASVIYAVCVSTAHSTEKDKDLFVSLRGKNYEFAHQVLLKSGYKPVDLRKVAGHSCMPGSEAICQLYPEVDACAVDDESPCRFDWGDEQR